MARVSKTNPFHARRLAEARANNEAQEEREEAQTQSRSNNEGQEEREETQTESKDEDDEKSSDEEWQEEEKKRKGKSPMKQDAKRGRGGPIIKGVVIGLPKVPEIDTSPKSGIGRGRRIARKTTFAVRMASYEQEEAATNRDPKGKGKEKMQETDEYEEDEACKRNTNDRDEDDDVMPGLVDN